MLINSNLGDFDAMRSQALQSLSATFEQLAEGAFVIDRQTRIVWANDRYLKFIGVAERANVIGRPIAEVVPTTRMPYVVETGKSIPFDLVEVNETWAVCSRFPIKNKHDEILGGFCLVLYANFDFMKPVVDRINQLRAELDSTRSKLDRARQTKYSFAQFTGNSEAASEVKRQAKRAATSDSTVLLLGETGTGKELVAHAIHAASSRAQRNFVAVNVSAIPTELVEAEFFGVAPGAYTGAAPKGRVGKMALANGGTLFLDEIADMPVPVQVKLLRALQEREIEPVGSNTVVPLDIRLIAATSKDLLQMVRSGAFRSDLYYRLNVLPIRLAPLRERREDIPMLAEVLVESTCQTLGIPVKEFAPSAIEALQSLPWPGNVRELQNFIERICVLSPETVLGADDVRRTLGLSEATAAHAHPHAHSHSTLHRSVFALQKEMVVEALAKAEGNRLRAARLLGISRSNLYTKLKQFDLD